MPAAVDRDPEAIRSLFNRVARRYDLANHLLSGGLDFWWRRRAATLVRQWRPSRILDLAAGSGDLALAIARQLPNAHITVADFSPAMLSIAKSKGLTSITVADALQLPFADNSFEVVAVAFGLRNMADWDLALHQMRRVLTPNGHLLILDFSRPHLPLLKSFYRFYLHRCLPTIAKLVTGEARAYRYLGASIEEFPCGNPMCELLRRNGFEADNPQPLSGGIVTIYTARKPNDSAMAPANSQPD